MDHNKVLERLSIWCNTAGTFDPERTVTSSIGKNNSYIYEVNIPSSNIHVLACYKQDNKIISKTIDKLLSMCTDETYIIFFTSKYEALVEYYKNQQIIICPILHLFYDVRNYNMAKPIKWKYCNSADVLHELNDFLTDSTDNTFPKLNANDPFCIWNLIKKHSLIYVDFCIQNVSPRWEKVI